MSAAQVKATALQLPKDHRIEADASDLTAGDLQTLADGEKYLTSLVRFNVNVF